MDMSLSLESAMKHIEAREERGGRPIEQKIIESGHKESIETRLPLLLAAMENGAVNYSLYNSEIPEFALICKIENRQITIQDKALLLAALGGSDQAIAFIEKCELSLAAARE